jgi:hypothetical protein
VNGTEQITGTLADGGRSAALVANRTQPRSPYNPAGRWPGRYTIDLSSLLSQPDLTVPSGAGLGTVTADTNGNARFIVTLADGTKFVSAGAISRDGVFPLYQALYGGKGSVFSPLSFTNEGFSVIVGTANWSKPARPLDRLYPSGFVNSIGVFGLEYSRTVTTNALAAGVASVSFSALPTPDATHLLTWNRSTRLTNSAGVALTLNPVSGLWTGVYPETTSRQRLTFQTTLQPTVGAFLGRGFLIQSNISGLVTFTVTPVP